MYNMTAFYMSCANKYEIPPILPGVVLLFSGKANYIMIHNYTSYDLPLAFKLRSS